MNNNHPSPDRPASRSALVVGSLAVGLAAVAAGSVWWFNQPSPLEQFERAQTAAAADPARGEELLRAAIAAAPAQRFPDAELLLCRLLVQRGQTDEVTRLFPRQELSQCRGDLLLTFAKAALKADQIAEAEAALRVLAERPDEDGATALELLRNHYLEWGQEESLIAVAWQAARRSPNQPRSWESLLAVLSQTSRHAECVAAVEEARQQTALPPEVRREFSNVLIEALVNLGDVPALERELAELRRQEGDTLRVRGHQVYLARLQGRLEDALADMESMMADNSVPPFQRSPREFQAHAYFTRGILLLDLRRFAAAAVDLERVKELQPFHSAARFKLSDAYRGLGRDAEAAQERATAQRITEQRKRVADLLRQRAESPLDPRVYEQLASLHRELGDTPAAERWAAWQRRVSASRPASH
ncbi:MAG: hypothetical protein U0935_20725 [Pirellulales bacterium]